MIPPAHFQEEEILKNVLIKFYNIFAHPLHPHCLKGQ